MRQSNYICQNLKEDIAKILNDLDNVAKLANRNRLGKNRIDNLVETFYDTPDKQLLYNGGFCRVVAYKEDALNEGVHPTRYFVDYKLDENSKLTRTEIPNPNYGEDISIDEIKKLLNLKIDIIEMLKLESNENRFLLNYIDSYLIFYNVGVCVDFVVSESTISCYDNNQICEKICILSLQDATAKCMGKDKAVELKEKIDGAFDDFEIYMEQILELNKATKNKYQIIVELIDPDTLKK